MTPTLFRSRQTGFSLIEIMVGLVIGMVGVIILSQVMLQSEDTKRNTTSGDDAQINASIALSSSPSRWAAPMPGNSGSTATFARRLGWR